MGWRAIWVRPRTHRSIKMEAAEMGLTMGDFVDFKMGKKKKRRGLFDDIGL